MPAKTGRYLNSESEHVCYGGYMNCVSGERLAAALASRRPELWDTNPRLAERIEMRIKDAQRVTRQVIHPFVFKQFTHWPAWPVEALGG
jgi:hypothetical protein